MKPNRLLTILLLLPLALCGADSRRPDLELASNDLDGSWAYVSHEAGLGHTSQSKKILWVFAGKKLTIFRNGRKQEEGQVRVNLSSSKPAFDIEFAGNSGKIIGIFQIQADELLLRYVDFTLPRPTSFAAGGYAFRFKRIK